MPVRPAFLGRRGRARRLSSRILAAQLGILAVTGLIGFALFAVAQRVPIERGFEQQALAVARTAASDPVLRSTMAAVAAGQPDDGRVQTAAERIRTASGTSYVVVIGLDGVRHSHPLPALIGQKVEEPIVVLDGDSHVGVNHGATGDSANARVPLYGPGGALVGEISTGIPISRAADELRDEIPAFLLYAGVALAVGSVASVLLARRLKRSTFGLELEELADLVRNREAMLHGIREGMVSFDPGGRITAVNQEARRLLGTELTVGTRLADALPDGRLRGLLDGTIEGSDLTLITDEHALELNRRVVAVQRRELGSVVTVRDRTEVVDLIRELDSAQALTDALRAQQHEFANRMHTLAGLLELGETTAAKEYAVETAAAEPARAEGVRQRIGNPLAVGLIVAKTAVAAERGVRLVLDPDSRLGDPPPHARRLATVVGNLLDNAVDAAADGPAPPGGREVRLLLVERPDDVTVRVEDTGPGVPAGAEEAIFRDGWSTRPGRGTVRRGLGLALVHRLVVGCGGSIEVSRGPGAVFTVVLPRTGGE